MLNFARIEKLFVTVFFVLIAIAACLVTILQMPGMALMVLLADFLIAGIISIFASLRLRDEEEEKIFR